MSPDSLPLSGRVVWELEGDYFIVYVSARKTNLRAKKCLCYIGKRIKERRVSDKVVEFYR